MGGSDVTVAMETLKELLPLFMAPAQVTSYERILRSRLANEKGQKDIWRFARSLVADCNIGMEPNEIPKNFTGNINFYYSVADETWPPTVDGLYEDFTKLWEAYTTGRFVTAEVAAVSHDELGGFKSPVFELVCQDLTDLVEKQEIITAPLPK